MSFLPRSRCSHSVFTLSLRLYFPVLLPFINLLSRPLVSILVIVIVSSFFEDIMPVRIVNILTYRGTAM